MYLLFVTLIFSLALGPDVKLLSAQGTEEELTSVMNNQSTIFSQVTQSSPGEETTDMNPDPTTARPRTVTENVEQTSGEIMMTSVPALQTSPEPAATPVFINNIMTNDVPTSAPPPESTSQPQQLEEIKSTTNIIITEPPQTSSPPPSISNRPATATKPPVLKEETTYTSPTATPATSPTTTPPTTPPTVPTTTPTTIMSTTTTITTTITITTPQEQTTPSTLMTSTTSSDTGGIGAGSKDEKGSEPNWLIVAVIVMVLVCLLITTCVMIICKRRKQSGKQQFSPVNGQKRSKKKKGPEDDVWAGPVKLGGGDCEDLEEGDLPGEEKKGDGVEVTGLSTFVMVEENGGVGRPGSPEVTKWEEKEPLLFIDEEGKMKRNEAGKSEDADANGEAGKSDAKEAEPNGGETFCLTTAV